MLTITKDLREWLPDDVIGAVMEVQVYTATVYVYIFIITKDLREWLYIYIITTTSSAPSWRSRYRRSCLWRRRYYVYNNDDVTIARIWTSSMEVRVRAIVFVAVTVYMRTSWGDHKREKAC